MLLSRAVRKHLIRETTRYFGGVSWVCTLAGNVHYSRARQVRGARRKLLRIQLN